MYFHVYLIYEFTHTFVDHSSIITRCWEFELQNDKPNLENPQTLAAQGFAPASFLSTHSRMNDPTQFEQVDETCRSGRVILHLKSLGMTAFLKISRQSEYETLKFKPLQIGVENAKVWRFEHRCLIWRFCKSFLPSGMASDFSMFDAAFWYYKTQYRKRHWLEMLYRKDLFHQHYPKSIESFDFRCFLVAKIPQIIASPIFSSSACTAQRCASRSERYSMNFCTAGVRCACCFIARTIGR